VAQVSVSPGGVPNRAIEQGIVTKNGIAGDGWRHPAFHGTSKRAILLMTSEGIDDLARRFPVYYGALGENITTRGLDRRLLRIGQRLRAGEAVIELTEVRLPCDTLSVYGTGIQSPVRCASAGRRRGFAGLGNERILRLGRRAGDRAARRLDCT